MSGTGAIRWGDISFRQNETTGRRRCGGRRRARSLHRWTVAGPGRATHRHPDRLEDTTWPAGPGQHRKHRRCEGRRRAVRGQAAVPEGGGRAWPGFETTRRAEGSRRGRLAGGPPPTGTQSSPAQQDSTPGARNTRGSTSNAGDQAGPQAAPPQRAEGNPYSPRNALIAGISRTACTRPAR